MLLAFFLLSICWVLFCPFAFHHSFDLSACGFEFEFIERDQWFLWLSVANRSNPLGIKHSPERRIGFPRSPFGLRILFPRSCLASCRAVLCLITDPCAGLIRPPLSRGPSLPQGLVDGSGGGERCSSYPLELLSSRAPGARQPSRRPSGSA